MSSLLQFYSFKKKINHFITINKQRDIIKIKCIKVLRGDVEDIVSNAHFFISKSCFCRLHKKT